MSVTQEEVEDLRQQVASLSRDICEQLPTLLAVLDFRKTTDLVLTRQRMQEGWYGNYSDGAFVAPTIGEYVGIFSDIDSRKMNDLKEALFAG